MSKEIFRKESLEQLSHPEQLDSLLMVVTPKAWIVLYTLIAFSIGVLLWAFFGSIPIEIQGKGILMNQYGVLFNVQAKVTGTIKKIYAMPGDHVKKGDLLVEMYDAEEEVKLSRIRLRVDTLQNDLERLKQEVSEESEADKEAQLSELNAKKFTVQQLDKKIEGLETLHGVQQKLYDEGVISRAVLRDTEDKLTNARIERESTKAAMATLNYNLIKGYRTEEIKQKEHDLIDALREQDLLEVRQPFYHIYSPNDSIVLGLLANPGDIVQAGTYLVWLEEKSAEAMPKVIYGFFPIEKGKRLNVGSEVKVALSTLDTQEYGYLEGTVKEVSPFASSKESIAKLIHNKEIIEYLSSGALAVIQVVIEPKIDPETGNYQWTSGKLPPIEITTGTVGTIQGIVKRIRPIYFVLPIERFQLS